MINRNEENVLADLAGELAKLDIPMAVIGAGARLLLLDWKLGLAQRTTTDWDLAVRVKSWDDYFALKTALIQSNLFREATVIHRLVHKTGVVVDIIPYGDLEDEKHTIVWPDDDTRMSVVGFEEALDSAEECQLSSGKRIMTVSLPALLLLKLLAFSERLRVDDLKDAVFILRHYSECIGAECVFRELGHELAEGALLYEYAGAFLLGKFLGRLCRPETLSGIEAIVANLGNPFSDEIGLLLGTVRDSTQEISKRTDLSRMFDSLSRGLESGLE